MARRVDYLDPGKQSDRSRYAHIADRRRLEPMSVDDGVFECIVASAMVDVKVRIDHDVHLPAIDSHRPQVEKQLVALGRRTGVYDDSFA
jgi:hypothetical protein